LDVCGEKEEQTFGIWGRQARGRERVHGRDRREQLPDEASDQTGISQDVLFFEEAEES
jgi:hypothetical protein